MPQVVVGAAASAVLAGFAQGFTVAVLAQAFIGSMILGGLSMALTPKPKKNQGGQGPIASNTFTIRQSDSTRKHVYGLTRFTDCYAQIVSASSNKKIHEVNIICDDEVDSIIEYWINDYPISPDQLDAQGNVTAGRYSGKLRLRAMLGSPNQIADPVMVAEIPEWNDNCRLRGIFYIYATYTKDQDVYPNGKPNISVVFKAKKIYDPRIDRVRWTPNIALFNYDYLNQVDYGYLAEDDDINLTNISAQATIADEIVDTIDTDMTVASVATSTDILTLTGDRLLFEIGDRCTLIVDDVTLPDGLDTGTDYYIIPYQIKTTPRIKLATTLDNAIDGVAIDITSAGSGSFIVRKNGEPRYHGAGVVDTADTLEDNINSMLSGLAGRAVCTGGAWRLLAGAWQEPTLDLGVGDMRGQIAVSSKVSMAERYNTISGLHISQLNDFQRADYPSYRNADYIESDKREYPKDMPLPFTSRPTTAKRIAKLEVLRARLEKIFNCTFSMRAMEAQAGDNIMITLDRRGWDSKPFEVTNFGFQIVEGDDNNMQLLTNLTVKETVESIYDWAASEDDPPLNLAPNTNMPDPFNVEVPSGVAFSSRAVETADADQVYTLVLSWNLHPDAFVVNNGFMEIQFKLSADTDWRPSFRVPGILIFSDVLVSSVNTAYDLRIRAVNNLGVRSNWATLLNASVGTSGGVGATNDWGNWTEGTAGPQDYGNWTEGMGAPQDWGFFT